ncbi:hypothetical protein TNCV_2161361 [Trichonephila clavipes]|nr:hypothetical protein TNCV_2161361 [Trichonephila clavipes]
MITNFFIPELNNHDVQELWFQQDSATCHTARATIDLLKDTFGDRLVSRFRPVNWPLRSCDLTPISRLVPKYYKDSQGGKPGLLGGQFMTEKSEECSSNQPVANLNLATGWYNCLAGKLHYPCG